MGGRGAGDSGTGELGAGRGGELATRLMSVRITSLFRPPTMRLTTPPDWHTEAAPLLQCGSRLTLLDLCRLLLRLRGWGPLHCHWAGLLDRLNKLCCSVGIQVQPLGEEGSIGACSREGMKCRGRCTQGQRDDAEGAQLWQGSQACQGMHCSNSRLAAASLLVSLAIAPVFGAACSCAAGADGVATLEAGSPALLASFAAAAASMCSQDARKDAARPAGEGQGQGDAAKVREWAQLRVRLL